MSKILLLDIEMAPNVAHVWGIWDQNIGLNQLRESSYVMCYAAKWLGDKKMVFDSVKKSTPKKMLEGIHKLLDEADAVIHYNGRRFDIPSLNKEFLLHGMFPPAPFKEIDLLTVAKSRFRFVSNKLDYVAQSLGLGKTISNPKVFTLDNQSATVTQGEEIPYQTTSDGTTSTSFKEAALKLQVTPSIIGDGNVLLDIQVNNDDADVSEKEPPISKMEIITKLLIADGDIVVIGGIKSENVTKGKEQVPGLGNVPVIGNLLKYKKDQDKLEELLIFIAPRILN